MKWVTEFNPDQQWASIQKEREKLIEQEREEIKNRPKDDDSFNLGGAL
jgi:hypothetical protein